MPKAELHIHIEGALEPELMFTLAKRNKIILPYKKVAEVKQAYQFTDLQSFLDIYYQAAAVLLEQQDFYDLTWAYLQKCQQQNVRHVEIFFDPQTHIKRGLSFATVINGIYDALQNAQSMGISGHLIMCILRHLDAADAMQTLEQALPYKDKIIAIGLDSSEKDNPPVKFREVFAKARQEGFLTVAHAGEEGSPDYIWQALNELKVSRIDHGVRCMEDNALVDYLAEKQIPLTVCPLSNLKLCVVKEMRDHPIKTMLEKGLCVTVNSDDPAYFGGYVNENFMAIDEALHLSQKELVQLAQNSFHASFISEVKKKKYITQLAQSTMNNYGPLSTPN